MEQWKRNVHCQPEEYEFHYAYAYVLYLSKDVLLINYIISILTKTSDIKIIERIESILLKFLGKPSRRGSEVFKMELLYNVAWRGEWKHYNNKHCTSDKNGKKSQRHNRISYGFPSSDVLFFGNGSHWFKIHGDIVLNVVFVCEYGERFHQNRQVNKSKTCTFVHKKFIKHLILRHSRFVCIAFETKIDFCF